MQRHFDADGLKDFNDVNPFLDAEIHRLFSETSLLDYQREQELFEQTFAVLNSALEESSFKKYNHEKRRYEGAFSLPVYEAVTVGVSTLLEEGLSLGLNQIEEKTQNLTERQSFIDVSKKRIRPLNRMEMMVALGKGLFREDKE